MSDNAPADDRLVRALAEAAPIRIIAARMTAACREGAERHGLAGVPAVALGRAMVAGVLMATLTKGNERVTLQISGDGPLRGITVDANDLGQVRGYVGAPGVEATTAGPGGAPFAGRPDVRLSTAPVVGTQGQVVVHRDLGLREIYQGTTLLRSGEVDEDLQIYLEQSEQMPSVLATEVLLDAADHVVWAGGVLVQTTPGAPPMALAHAAERVSQGWVAARLRTADDLEAALSRLVGAPAKVLEWRLVQFHCQCSADRVAGALKTLGSAELREMLVDDGQAEVTCRFCGEMHRVDAAGLRQIIDELESEAGAKAKGESDSEAEAEADTETEQGAGSGTGDHRD
jgi:molecular chaperone Hsp33